MTLARPILVLAACLAAQTAAPPGGPAPAPPAPPAAAAPQEKKDKSYAVGFSLGKPVGDTLRADGVEADVQRVLDGFRDGLDGRKPPWSRQDMESMLAAVNDEMERRMVRRLLGDSPEFRAAYEKNKLRSQRFHELFGEQAGVITLPDGVQYKPLRSGDGPRPGPQDTVLLSGSVKLLDGTVLVQGSDIEVHVADTVRGAAELLRLMPVGSKWQFAIPPEMAHGEAGQMPAVGPNETLTGMVELVAIR